MEPKFGTFTPNVYVLVQYLKCSMLLILRTSYKCPVRKQILSTAQVQKAHRIIQYRVVFFIWFALYLNECHCMLVSHIFDIQVHFKYMVQYAPIAPKNSIK